MSRHPDIRPRRSALYVPGSNARALEKARTLDADVLIFDLEDGVAPDRKEEARAQIIAALAQGGYDAELVIRVNHPASRLGAADIKAAARSGAHHREEVVAVDRLAHRLGRVAEAALAYGGMAPFSVCAKATEQFMVGKKWTQVSRIAWYSPTVRCSTHTT